MSDVQSPRRDSASNSDIDTHLENIPTMYSRSIEKYSRTTHGISFVLLISLPYFWWYLDNLWLGYASTIGLGLDLSLSERDGEDAYLETMICLTFFSWLGATWSVVPLRKFLTFSIIIQATIASLQSAVASPQVFLFLRSILGICGAVFLGTPLFISRFARKDLAMMVAALECVVPFATSVIGPLLWMTVPLLAEKSILSWRSFFFVEGAIGYLVAFLLWVKYPVLNTLSTDESTDLYEKVIPRRCPRFSNLKFWRFGFVRAILDLKNFVAIIMLIFVNMAVASTPSYLTLNSNQSFSYMPYYFFSLIADLSHSNTVFHLLVAAPYLLSSVIVIITAYLSDMLQVRGWFVCFHALISSLGLGLMAVAGASGWSLWWQYVGMFPACCGYFGARAVLITWTLNNEQSFYKRALVFTIVLTFGQLGTTFSPAGIRPYWQSVDEPLHVRGLSLCGALMGVVAILAYLLRIYLLGQNRMMRLLSCPDIEEEFLVSDGSWGEESSYFEYII